MAQLEVRANETPQQYQQRRDLARSNYFMIERNHEEDDNSFRTHLDTAGEKLRDRTAAFGSQVKDQGQSLKSRLSADTDKAKDQARAAAEKGKEQARAASEKAKQLYRDNAVIGGLVAVAAGAIAGERISDHADRTGQARGHRWHRARRDERAKGHADRQGRKSAWHRRREDQPSSPVMA